MNTDRIARTQASRDHGDNRLETFKASETLAVLRFVVETAADPIY
jgi:hypothetical protein